MPDAPGEKSSDASILTAHPGPIVIGHRGASGAYPENTLLSFQKAVEFGVQALEFDVRCSRDGVPVVIHDATLDRTTNGSGAVADMTAEELRRWDAGQGEKIPTLVEVLNAFANLPLLIDLKAVAAAGPVLEVLTALEATARVVVGSFEHAALGPFRRASIRTTASRRETALWWAASRVGVTPPRDPFVAFSVPEWSGRIHVVDRRFLARAKKRNLPVHVWTVDDVNDAERLWALGVAGLITNRPAELVALLKRTAG